MTIQNDSDATEYMGIERVSVHVSFVPSCPPSLFSTPGTGIRDSTVSADADFKAAIADVSGYCGEPTVHINSSPTPIISTQVMCHLVPRFMKTY